MAHGTHAGPITDRMVEDWVARLEVNAQFDQPWVDAAVEWLLEAGPPGVVVDVGCGAGGAAQAFAKRLPGSSQVTGIDPEPRLLEIAERTAREHGLGARIDWTSGSVGNLPIPAGSADLVWASGVVHHVADQQAAVSELAALVRPGGRVALVEGGLSMRCLPHEIGLGRPGLEGHVEEARTRWFIEMRDELPGVPMPYGWPEALRRAGLVEVQVRSFIAEAAPPLDAVGRTIIEAHLTSAREQLGDRLDDEDRASLTRLLDPEDPAFVGGRDDLVVTAVRTVQVGSSPSGQPSTG